MKHLNPEHKQDAFEAKRLMVRYHAAQDNFRSAKKEAEECKKEIGPTILGFMKKMRPGGVTKLSFKLGGIPEAHSKKYVDTKNPEGYELEVRMVSKFSVVFDADKLESAIGWLAEDCIEKEYSIVDIEKMKELLKKHGVSAADFRALVHVKKTVNNKKLDDLESLGQVSKQELKGTYSVVPVSEYLQTKLVECADEKESGGE